MWNRISAEFYRLHSELSRIFLILWTNIGIVEKEKITGDEFRKILQNPKAYLEESMPENTESTENTENTNAVSQNDVSTQTTSENSTDTSEGVDIINNISTDSSDIQENTKNTEE